MRFAVILALILSQGPQQQKADTTKRITTTNQRGTPQAPFIIQLDSVQRSQEAQQREGDRKEKAASDAALIFYTKLLAFVAFLQLLVFGYQAVKLRASVNRMQEAEKITGHSVDEMRRAADAALISANAAKASVEAAMGTERAYLFVDPFAIARLHRKKGALEIGGKRDIVVTNYGKTPAIVSWISVGLAYAASREDAKKASLAKPQLPLSAVAVSANAQLPKFGAELEASAEELAAAKQGKGRVYLFGNLEYKDVFGAKHRTGFCGSYNFRTEVFVPVDDPELNYNT